MHLLVLFAFLAGFVTVLSPCILPVLPIVLSGASVGGRRYPLGIVLGFILSFTFFTLFLTQIVSWIGLDPNILRVISVGIILIFGLVLLIPKLHTIYELWSSRLASKAGTKSRAESGFLGGVIVGTSLGLLWTPCVGPILASVIALALTGSVTGSSLLITLAYAIGTAIPMFLIMLGGRALLNRVPWLTRNLRRIQGFFGFLLIIVAILITFNLDRKFQVWFLESFPNYDNILTQVENNDAVKEALGQEMDSDSRIGIEAPEIIPGGEWFNSNGLELADLKGKVVLVDFWTYSCINCIRTLPYIKDWHEKYEDSGLVIIGVHTPEFEFEKSAKNLEKFIRDEGLSYPIVQDNDYSTWRAYENHYWPAKFFIDHNGILQSIHIGEGDYEESEKLIQNMLMKAGYSVDAEINDISYANESSTPETYLGYRRTKGFASEEPIAKDSLVNYSLPEELEFNTYALDGEWTIFEKHSVPEASARLRFNYKSKNVFLVMNPTSEIAAEVEVYLDDEYIKTISVDSDQLYELIESNTPEEHLLELRFPEAGVELYAFTFG